MDYSDMTYHRLVDSTSQYLAIAKLLGHREGAHYQLEFI